MRASAVIILLIIVIAVVAFGYISLYGKPTSPSSQSTTSLGTTYHINSSTIANGTNAQTSTRITSTINNPQNRTITIQQVIIALGTGWTAASQYSYGATYITSANGSKENVQGIGIANFSNGGSFLATKWIQFDSASAAYKYINSTFRASFPNAANVTNGMQGNATYIFYAGDSINNGQAASLIYAYDGNYGILIFNQGTTFPLNQAKQLLSYQLSDLKIS